MPEDYEQEVTIKGFDGTVTKTVRVDIDGQLYTLLVGANGQTLVLDATGHIISVMQGQYGDELKTLLCDVDGRLLAQLMGMYGSTPIPIACDASGRLSILGLDQTNINADSNEAQTLDTPILTLVSNLNRIRHWIITLSGEAWGTVTTSTAALLAKFHATTGHAHSGAASDGKPVSYNNLTDQPTIDFTPYTRKDGSVAFTGNQSMGSFALKNLGNPSEWYDGLNIGWMQTHAWGKSFQSGTASPLNVVTPGNKGGLYIDYLAVNLYIATGTTSASWRMFTRAAT